MHRLVRAALLTLSTLALVAPQIASSQNGSAQNGLAQNGGDREGVRLAVLDYVEGFYLGDSTRLVRSVWPQVRKYGYHRANAAAPYAGQAMPYAAFMQYANGIKAGRSKTPPNAPKEITIFDVADQTASAKLTAWWGIDYLLLAKENGRWMITQVLWQSPPPK